MAEPTGFFARWSRRKQAARQSAAVATGQAAPATALPPADLPPSEPPPELPPLVTLSAESDYSMFMRPGVPLALRNAALRKLWRSDPVYANLDGLLEYGEDYAAHYRAASGVVATVYRVLKGMPRANEPLPAERAPAPAGSQEAPSSEVAPAGEAAAEEPETSSGRPDRDDVSFA